ncbi:MAG TPA: fibronectin type III domain-containing protein [Acidimicrobiales bacterium]|nr:fibronectin type III domain-containing protein [Acidimicrobiales bacterium]
MAIGRGGSWGRVGSKVRRGASIASAVAAGALLVPVVVAATATPAGASAVTNGTMCVSATSGAPCGTKLEAGLTTDFLLASFDATTALSSSDAITVDGPVTSQFATTATYDVLNDTLNTHCAATAVTFSNSGATVTIGVPAGCTASAGQRVSVLIFSMTTPSAAGYYAWGVHTTADTTEVPTSRIAVTSVPGAPTSPIATVGEKRLTLSWTAPSFDGLLPLTAYDVYCSASGPPSTSGTPTGTVDASNTTLTLLGLVNGLTYRCVVTAVNGDGQSAASPIVSGTPNPTAPPPPRAVHAANGLGFITVSWVRPGLTGGKPITAYDVYCSTTNPPSTSGTPSATVAATTTPLEAKITGLPVGNKYYCVVTTINSIGPSVASIVVTAYSATVPRPPTAPSAVPTNASEILVSWTAPSGDGGEPIAGYIVYCSVTTPPSTKSSPCAEVGPGATSTQVGGLASSTTYYFEVVAVNAIGKSAPSGVVHAATT